jgi:hypothetical protein
MTVVWTWDASEPGAGGSGVCADPDSAARAWMRAHQADAGLVEEASRTIAQSTSKERGRLRNRHVGAARTLARGGGRPRGRWRGARGRPRGRRSARGPCDKGVEGRLPDVMLLRAHR